MRNAVDAIQHRPDARLLVVRGREISHEPLAALPAALVPGDLVVVNDAATLPASLVGYHRESGGAIELRLAGALVPPAQWRAVLFGRGDWHVRTEDRPAPPSVAAGDTLEFRFGLTAKVAGVSERSGRLLGVHFEGDAEQVLHLLYRAGAPVQYSYLRQRLALWDQQSVFAGPPVSVEPPSASFPFTWKLVFGLKCRGVRVARLTHAAGLSTTGDAELDRELPFPERYEIPAATAAAVNETLERGGRVIAIGTTVTRALESAFDEVDGRVRAGPGVATLRISRDHRRRVVSGILTGLHEKGASHLELLASFVPPEVLEAAYAEAGEKGYLWHEYGDSSLILSAAHVFDRRPVPGQATGAGAGAKKEPNRWFPAPACRLLWRWA